MTECSEIAESGVAEQHIQRALLLLNLIDDPLNALRFRNFQLYEFQMPDFAVLLLITLQVAGSGIDGPAFLGEFQGRGQADAG
ncbi:hypothetical protein D3C75_713320 [compost metagenome]